MMGYIYWDPSPEIFVLPIVHWPILWYGLFFALGFGVGFIIFYSLLIRLFEQTSDESLAHIKKRALWLTDRFTLYIVLSTVIGARLGHFLFYENPSHYLSHPLEILQIWKGGLASHGAAVGIVVGTILFAHFYRAPLANTSWLRLLDFVSIPTAFAGACIRLGNFCNQEILGTPSTLPWAVLFAHPMDQSAPIPRHPVQLYESLFYLLTFLLLWKLSRRLPPQGRLLGLFLLLVFGGRFLLEFLKVEQSTLLLNSSLTMGQWLSILPIFLSLWLLYRTSKLRGSAP